MPRPTLSLLLLALLAASCERAPADAEPQAPASPPTWHARLDEPGEFSPTDRITERDGGLEVTQGPNATLWREDLTASGSYRLAAEVTHLDSGLHPHGAGIVFGGADVRGAKQRYTYFLVRAERAFLIKTREGAETQDVVPWQVHRATGPDKDGVTHNRLAVEVGPEETRFLINDQEVHVAKTADLPTDGQYGYRLVHDLHVRFGPLQHTAQPQ